MRHSTPLIWAMIAILLLAVVSCAKATPTPTPTPSPTPSPTPTAMPTPTVTPTATPTPVPTPTPMPIDTQLEAALGWVPVQYASVKVGYVAYQAAAIASGFEDFKGIETIKEEGYPRFFWGVEPELVSDWYSYWPRIGLDPYASDLGVYSEEDKHLYFHVFEGGFDKEEVIANLSEMGYKTDSYQGVDYYYFWNDTEKGSYSIIRSARPDIGPMLSQL